MNEDSLKELYDKITFSHSLIDAEIERLQKVRSDAALEIHTLREQKAKLPRAPIQRTRKAAIDPAEYQGEALNKKLDSLAAGKGLLSGKGTLSVHDADGNDITAQVTTPVRSGGLGHD